MSNFSVKATFDGQELIQGFKDVKTEINGLKTAGQTAGQSLDKMLQQRNSTTNFARQLSQIKQQLTDLSVNYSRLTEAERNSEFGVAMAARIDELKIKAQELKGVFDDVNESLKSESVADFGEQWSQLQRQTEQTRAKFEGIQKISSGVASGFAALQGVTALLGGENQNLQKALVKVQSAMAIAQGVNGIKDLYEGLMQAKLAFTAKAKAANAATAATIKTTAATGKATLAQKAFNVVANANPYVLLATAVVAVGAALFTFAKRTADAEEAQEEYNKKLEEQKEKEKSRRETVASSVGDVVSKYKILQRQWQSLSNEQERNTWIRENAEAFKDLGLAINDVNSANRVLVANAEAVTKALMLQAQAAALQELYKESYKEAYQRSLEIDQEITDINKRWVSGAEFTTSEFNKYNISAAERNTTPIVTEETNWFVTAMIGAASTEGGPSITSEVLDNTVNAAGAKRIRTQLVNDLEAQRVAVFAESDKILEDLIEKEKEAAAATKAAGLGKINGGGSGGGSTTPPRTLSDETAAYKEAINEQESLYKNGLISYQQYLANKKSATDSYVNAIINLEGDITEPQAEQIRLAQELSNNFSQLLHIEEQRIQLENEKLKSANEYASSVVKTLQLEDEGILDAKESREQQIIAARKYYNFLISNWPNLTDAEKENARAIKSTIDAYEELKDVVPRGKTVDYRNQQINKANDVLDKYEAGIITKDVAQKAIDEINADLASLQLNPIEVRLDTTEAISNLEAFTDSANSIFSSIQALGSVVSSIDSVYQSFKNMGQQLDEAENGWERFMIGFNAGMQILNAVTSVFATINTLVETFNTLQAISTALKLKDATASGVKATADTAAATAAGTEAAANTAAAVSGAAKSVSWIPIVGAVLAVAAIAAVIGGIIAASNKAKFATGGIVPGSGIGDMNLVRVNGGEMILNGRQQKNLFRMLDQNRLPVSGGAGEVKFRIQGDTLVGAIENYNKKISKR